MNKQILEIFIDNFMKLYSECLKSTQDNLDIEYFSSLQDVKSHIDHLDLCNDETKEWYESHLLGVLTRANYYRANYPKDTYEFTVFNSIFDLALETLKDFNDAV